jgi:hypothetical protein
VGSYQRLSSPTGNYLDGALPATGLSLTLLPTYHSLFRVLKQRICYLQVLRTIISVVSSCILVVPELLTDHVLTGSPDWAFRGSPQYLQANFGTVPSSKLGQSPCLPANYSWPSSHIVRCYITTAVETALWNNFRSNQSTERRTCR